MKSLSYIPVILMLMMLNACSSHKNDNPAPPAAPAAAVLVFPAQNSICVSGSVVSATLSSIQFQWNKAENSDSYVLTIKNLLTGISQTQTATDAQATVTLLRNTPYSWSVTSRSTKSTQTTTGDTWKFYNAGNGVTSYAPFPADKLSPGQGDHADASSGTLTLNWVGSDPDNDIAGYDVYFGTSASPALYKQGVTATSLPAVPISKGITYYWKVITHDSQGNSSESDIIQFNGE